MYIYIYISKQKKVGWNVSCAPSWNLSTMAGRLRKSLRWCAVRRTCPMATTTPMASMFVWMDGLAQPLRSASSARRRLRPDDLEHSWTFNVSFSWDVCFHIRDIRNTWGNLPIWSICQSGLQQITWAIWTFNPVKRRAKPSTGYFNSWRFFRLTCPGRFGSPGRSEDCTFGVSLTGCGQSSPCVGLWGAQGSDGTSRKPSSFKQSASYQLLLYPIIKYHIIPYSIICYTILYHIIPCYTIINHIMIPSDHTER